MSHQKNNPAGVVPEKISLSVKGMACASCVRHVENALAGRDGILGVAVSLNNGLATVVYDQARIGMDDIRRIIEATGYKVA